MQRIYDYTLEKYFQIDKRQNPYLLDKISAVKYIQDDFLLHI